MPDASQDQGVGSAAASESTLDAADARARVQRLFLQHSDAIRAYVRGLAPPQVDADEIFQDTFVTIAEKAEHYDPQAIFLTWAIGIARMKILGRIRDFRQRGGVMLSIEVIDHLARDAPDEDALEDDLAALEFCIRRLSPSGYRLLRMFYFEGLSGKSIASKLNINARSVYNGLDRIRHRLRQCIQQRLGEASDVIRP